MYLQNERYLNPTKTWGCYVLTLGAMVEKVTGKSKTGLEVLNLLHECYNLPTDDGVNYLTKWIEEAFVPGLPEIEILTPPGPVLRLWGLDYEFKKKEDLYYLAKEGEEVIDAYYLQATNSTHFVLASWDGEVLYDSLGKSRAVGEGVRVSRRIYGPR